MPDPTISYEFRTFNDPPGDIPLGPGGQNGSFETFTDSVPTTFYAVRAEQKTRATMAIAFAAGTFGVSTCPACPEIGARGWR